VYGVVTFYNFFKLRKPGEHIVTSCLGTACYVKGVEQIIEAIEKEFNVKRGHSTADGKLSLLITRCIGACATAPNIIVDDEVIAKATSEITKKRIREALKEEKPIEVS
jgi:NADH:ubiquinone oxidoreductase subunit E